MPSFPFERRGRCPDFISRLLGVLETASHKPAFTSHGVSVSYRAFSDKVAQCLVWLDQQLGTPRPGSRIAFLATKEIETYALIIACTLSGRTFIPISRKNNEDRIREILGTVRPQLFVSNTPGDPWAFEAENPGSLVWSSVLERWDGAGVEAAPLYILFTSGSTGRPKGVPIHPAQFSAFLNNALDLIPMVPSDVCSQFFDLSFDLAYYDIFATLCSGATLCLVTEEEIMFAPELVNSFQMTSLFMVPTMGSLLMQGVTEGELWLLAPRRILFCGEPLSRNLAESFARVAPNAVIWNLYGPTELTVFISSHRFDPRDRESVVPIGRLLPGHTYKVPEAGGQFLLEIEGPQQFQGYLETDGQPPSCPRTIGDFYSTGDFVSLDDRGVLHFRGRNDRQIKKNGYRIELGEVESRVAQVQGILDSKCVLLESEIGPQFLLLLVTRGISLEGARNEITEVLPSYMIPEKLAVVDNPKRTPSGKTDWTLEIERLAGGKPWRA